MNHLAGTVNKRRIRSRGALGLFVAVWLNLALAPCAMAYEAEADHDCPHCPPAEMQGHHGDHAGMQAQASCADNLSDCGLDGEFSHDARNGQSKPAEGHYELPVVAAADALLQQHTISIRQRAPPLPALVHSGAAPRLHLFHCVFLD